MDPNQQQQNPLASLQALLGGASPAAVPPTPQPAAVPSGGGAPPMASPPPMPQQGGGMGSIIPGLMAQSQQALNSPMGQAVPGQAGMLDPQQHPIVAALIKGLANAAQSFGWTAMQPQERLERTQLQQNKAESLARLAETGAYQGGILGVRGQQEGINQQKADTAEKAEGSLSDYRKFEQQNAQDKLALATDANQWKQEMASGRLDKAQQMIDQKATQFEQKLSLATKQFGLDETKVALQGEGTAIKQGMLDLARTALSQKGTVEGAQAMSKIQQFKIDHPIMSQFMDMSDLDQLVGGAQGAGLPGVNPTQSPVVPQSSTAPTVGAPANKAQAKGGGGGTHLYFDAQGNQINAGR